MASDGRGKVKTKNCGDTSKPYDRPKSLLSKLTHAITGYMRSSRHPSKPVNAAAAAEAVNVGGASKQPSDHQTSDDSGFNSRTTADGVLLEFGGYQATFDSHYDLGNQTVPVSTPPARPPVSSTSPAPSVTRQRSPGFGFVKMPPSASQPPSSRDFCTPRVVGFGFVKQTPGVQPSAADNSYANCSADVSFAGKRNAPSSSCDDLSTDVCENREKSGTPLKRQCLERDFDPSATPMEAQDSASRTMKHSFLWSTKMNSSLDSTSLGRSETAASKKPRFELDTFESTLRNRDTSLLGSNHRQSPFYPGKTTYGGASSRQKLFKHLDSQYKMVQTVRQKVQVEQTPHGANESMLSATSRKILEGLEHYEQSRQPECDPNSSIRSSLVDSPLFFSPSTIYRQNSVRKSGPTFPAKGGPPVREMPTPTPAVIRNSIRTYQNLDESSRKTTGPATGEVKATASGSRSMTDLSSSYIQPSSRAPGKMKRESTRKHISAVVPEKEDEEEMEPDLQLSDIRLPITDMKPLFSAVSSSSSVGSGGSSASGVSTGSQLASTFTFSLPLSVSNNSTVTTNSELKKFQFRSPIAIEDRVTSVVSSAPMEIEPAVAPVLTTGSLKMSFDLNSAVKKSQPPPSSLSSSNADSPGLGGFGTAKELKQGSVLDVLEKSKSSPAKTAAATSTAPVAAAPFAAIPITATPGSTNMAAGDQRPLSEVLKIADNSWPCPTCLVRNGSGESLCPCCGTTKPLTRPASSSSSSQSAVNSSRALPIYQSNEKPLSEVFKKKSDTWSCPECMVVNNISVPECPCCATKRPPTASDAKADVVKTTEVKATSVTFAPVTEKPLSEVFKKKSDTWSCPTCMVVNNISVAECPCCMTKRPSEVKATQASNKAEDLNRAGEAPKPDAAQKPPSTNSNNSNALASSGLVAVASDGNGFKFNTAAFGSSSQSASSSAPAAGSGGFKVEPSGGFKLNIPTGGFSGLNFGMVSQSTGGKEDLTSSSGGFKLSGFTGFGATNAGTSNGKSETTSATSVAVTASAATTGEKSSAVTSGSEISSANPLNSGFGVKFAPKNESNDKPVSSGFSFSSSGSVKSTTNAPIIFGGSAVTPQNPLFGSEKDKSKGIPEAAGDPVLKTGVTTTTFGSSGFNGSNPSSGSTAAPFSFTGAKASFGSAGSEQAKFSFTGTATLSGSTPLPNSSSLSSTVVPTQTGVFAQPSTVAEKVADSAKPSFTFGQNPSAVPNPPPTYKAEPTPIKFGQAASDGGAFKFGVAPSNPSEGAAGSFGQNPLSNSAGGGSGVFKFGQSQPSQEIKPSASNSNLFTFGQQQKPASNNMFQFGTGSNTTTPSAGLTKSTNNQPIAAPAFGQHNVPAPSNISFGNPAPATGGFSFGSGPSQIVPPVMNVSALQGTKRSLTDDNSGTKRGRVGSEDMQMQDEPASASASASGGFGFNPAPTSFVFGSQQPAASSSNFFGPKPAAMPTPAFQAPAAAPPQPFNFTGQQNATNVANGAANTGIAFGSGVNPSSGFNFSATPSFNFTGTSANQPTNVTFNAQPNAATPIAGRVIKKAMRRTQKH